MNQHGRILLAATLLASLSVLGCARSVTPGVTEDEVVFGVTAPLSGPAAAWGAVAQGARAWADIVNGEGGVNGRRIRLLMKDDAYTPGRAVANVTELETEVLALVGMVGTAVVNAARDTIVESGIPLVLPTANVRVWEDLPGERPPPVFVAYPDYRSEGAFLGEQVATGAGATTAAVFYQNDDYGKDGLEGARRGLTEAGVELVAEVPYELQDRELGLHALQIRDSGAEAVVLYCTPTHAANLVNEMAKLDFRPELFASGTLGDERAMFRLLGDAWSGARYVGIVLPRGDERRDRLEARLLAQDPSLENRELFAIIGAAGMMAAIEALRGAGPEPTRESFVAALEQATIPDVLVSPISFAPDRRHGFSSAILLRAGSGPAEPPTVLTEPREFTPLF